MPKLRVIIKPPPEPTGDAERDVEAQRDYLLQMSEELAYVLTHIEADNINDTTFERISQMIPKASVTAPPMDGAGSPGGSSTWARGDHQHPADTNKADVTALEETAGDLADHAADKGNPHEVTKAQVGLDQVANERQYSAQNPPPIPTPGEVGAIPVTEKGSAGGVAELDANGMVPSAQLPSYVDDVLEYASLSDFPSTGESGKIYVALDTGRTYRWSGSAYTEISESLALGETSSTAYRGDRGKIAYDHSQTTGNPHGTTAAEVGARPDNWTPTAADVGARPDDWMPSKADVGLGNVENERQYSAQNPPPYPVTSVNGRTGAVSLDAADVGARPDNWVPDAEDVPYDNTQSGLMATDVQAAIDEIVQGGGGGGTAAVAVSYDNTGSGLVAANVQDAIDEVYGDIPAQPSDIGAQSTITANGILKGDGAGGVSAAVAGTDYQAPLTAGTDYATPGMIPIVPSAYASNPEMDGTASPGSSGAWAKGDHVHPTDSTKAAKSDLTSIQATGTTNTTGAVIPAGAYFYLNGVLYRAKEQIDQNAAFTVNTNCEQVTDGGFNDLLSTMKPSISSGTVAASKASGFVQVILSAGGLCIVFLKITTSVSVTTSDTLASVDSAYKPSARQQPIQLLFQRPSDPAPVIRGDRLGMYLNTDGTITQSLSNALPSGALMQSVFIYAI